MNKFYVEFKAPPKVKNKKEYCPLCTTELKVYLTEGNRKEFECPNCEYFKC
jgi:transposase-like protein